MNKNTYESRNYLETVIDDEVNALIHKGSVYMFIFSSIATIVMIGFSYYGLVRNIILPTSACIFGIFYSLFLYLSSRNNHIRGRYKIYVVLPAVIFPFSMFLVSHFTTDYGTATYLNAPIVFVYFIGLILTGFLFDLKVSVFLGAIYSAEFYLSYLLGKERIELIAVPDPLMQQTLTSPHIYVIKAILILLGAILVGLIAVNSKRLLIKIMLKEKERDTIDRIFGQYVSPSVKIRITEGISETKGQRKEAAVLIADLRSFTSYVENHSLEIVINQLNEYFSRMIICIERNKGVVHDFVGDSIMAVFGGLIETNNPCDNALKACDEMIDKLQILNDEWNNAGMESFMIGVGMHYGEITMGAIGSDTRKEYKVIGDIVNTASRMESLTKEKGFTAICSKIFYENLSNENKKNGMLVGHTEIKGKKNAMIIYGYHNEENEKNYI